MDTILSDLVNNITIGKRQAYENLTIFSLMSINQANADFVTLDDALENHGLMISEVNEAGESDFLKISNPSAYQVLLMAGEEVVGGIHNRIINATILVGPTSQTIAPVSCVEECRRGTGQSSFRSKSRVMSASLRQKHTDNVSRNLASKHAFLSNQAQIWEGINRKFWDMRLPLTRTQAMSDLHDSLQTRADRYEKRFFPVENQIGMLVLIDDKPVGIEIINNFQGFRRSHKKLVNSYVIDALETSGRMSFPRLTGVHKAGGRFLNLLSQSEFILRPSVALGNYLRLETPEITGAGLERSNEILQLTAFTSVNWQRPMNVFDFALASRTRELSRK